MDAKELIRAGRLPEARSQLIEEVRSSPAASGKRTLLFQVLILFGEWDKAERHLETLAAQDVGKEIGAQVYKNIIQAERDRVEVARLNRRAEFLPQTPPYLETHYAAWQKVVDEQLEEAQGLFGQVEAQRPTISGTLDGKDFVGFQDTDTLLSPFLEAIVHERYVWIPFEAIRELSVSPPKTLFDLIWTSARLTTWEGLTLNCYLPVLYPESFLHEDDRVKLGRMTDWAHLGGSFSRASGQHVYQIGEEDVALLEIQEAVFNFASSGESGESSD